MANPEQQVEEDQKKLWCIDFEIPLEADGPTTFQVWEPGVQLRVCGLAFYVEPGEVRLLPGAPSRWAVPRDGGVHASKGASAQAAESFPTEEMDAVAFNPFVESNIRVPGIPRFVPIEGPVISETLPLTLTVKPKAEAKIVHPFRGIVVAEVVWSPQARKHGSFLKRFRHLSYDVTPSPLGGYTYSAHAISPDGKSESKMEGTVPTTDDAFYEIFRWLEDFYKTEDSRFDAKQWKAKEET